MNNKNECCGGNHSEDHECCGGNHNEEHECCGGNHDHEHGDCGCGHNHGEDEYQTIKLSLEDGREITAAVIEMFELEEKTYIALLPIGEESVLLYEFKQHEDGIELINIESEEEYESVSQAFLSLMDFDEEDEQ